MLKLEKIFKYSRLHMQNEMIWNKYSIAYVIMSNLYA